MYCTNCGAELLDNAKFCQNCGHPVTANPTAPPTAAPTPAPTAPTSPTAPTTAPTAAPEERPAPAGKKKAAGRGRLVGLLVGAVVLCLIVAAAMNWGRGADPTEVGSGQEVRQTEGSQAPGEEIRETEPPKEPEEATPVAQVTYIVDYLGMTMGELIDLYGQDFELGDGWWYGSAKAVAFEAAPFIFCFVDEHLQVCDMGDVTGEEEICMVYYAGDTAPVAPGFACSLTYDELNALGRDGWFDGSAINDEFWNDDGAVAIYSVEYAENMQIEYRWYDGDPFHAPAEEVRVILH